MQIIFFRHGIAADRLPHQTDADRPLTDEGVTKTTRIVAGLAKLIDMPAVILTSPKLRARQTADLLGAELHVEPQVVEKLGAGSVNAVIETLAEYADEKLPGLPGCPGVVIVGHEPDLSEAVEMLLVGQTLGRMELKKAGAACVRTTGPIRRGRACGNLMWLATPQMWK